MSKAAARRKRINIIKKISYHKKPWKDGYFKSAGRGQEFVIMDNNGVEEWARNKIEESQIDR